MKVQEVMSSGVQSCSPDSNLATAARLMWDNDCGALPVAADGKVTGMITDRDICIAAAAQNRPLADIAVKEVISGNVYACRPEDDLRYALETMRKQQVRRLPVVDSAGRLHGILSINDLVLKAKRGKKKTGLSYGDVVSTLKAIFAHPDSTETEPDSETTEATDDSSDE